MINIKKIKPLFTKLITTADCYEEDVKTSGVIDVSKQRGTLKEYQKVVAIGDAVAVRGIIKVGDLVSINPTRFAVKKNPENSIKNDIEGGNPVLRYNFDQVIMDGKNYLLLEDRDIEFIIEEFEEIPDETSSDSSIIKPPTDIIV